MPCDRFHFALCHDNTRKKCIISSYFYFFYSCQARRKSSDILVCVVNSERQKECDCVYIHNFKYANDLLEAGGVCKTLWPQKSNMNEAHTKKKMYQESNRNRNNNKQIKWNIYTQLIIITTSVWEKKSSVYSNNANRKDLCTRYQTKGKKIKPTQKICMLRIIKNRVDRLDVLFRVV